MVRQFLRSREGATAVEYALIAGVLVIAIVAGMAEISRAISQTYGSVAGELGEAAN